MTRQIPFDHWFETITGHSTPHFWQSELAQELTCRNRLIRIPTGLGKTEGVLAAWSFHRVLHGDDSWPRRLVWCLPMRVLVEQTEQVARTIMTRMVEQVSNESLPAVHVLMGGEDAGEWFLHPERPAVLIGTQDMLLSRALNRGYASARARWPVEFGLLNHDALWVMDEVQLMDAGLATSAQLQAFRGADAAQGKSLRPCRTWWMSATLQPDWLKTVDTADSHRDWIQQPCEVAESQRTGGLWDIAKTLACEVLARDRHREFAQLVLREHATLVDGPHGKITLVVCNTVQRANETFDALRSLGRTTNLELVHSRFRPHERDRWRDEFLNREACRAGADRIVVATQVVEAGVDLSAGCLITELAPWPSLVQRFGRCARYGGSGRVVVIDRGRDDKSAPPYASEELESAWDALQGLNDVGVRSLETFDESLSEEGRARLYPYAPAHLLLRREFDELFDTTPDLTGADLDVSRFIRSGDERDLQVFWIDIAKDERTPSPKCRPQREELCSVPFLQARDWLCGEETKSNRKPRLRGTMRAWVWDWLDGEWVEANRTMLLPGRVVCVAAVCGGYRVDRGFDPDAHDPVPAVETLKAGVESEALSQSDNQQDGEGLSVLSDWKTIACHSREVAEIAEDIASRLGLADDIKKVLALAGNWHDVGKSHPAFQGALRSTDALPRPARQDLAKGPAACWLRKSFKHPCIYRCADADGQDTGEVRPALRHELASALALFAVLETFAPEHPALLGTWGEALRLLDSNEPQGASHGSGNSTAPAASTLPLSSTSAAELTSYVQHVLDCSVDDFNLLAYLVGSHHGKVRVALHAAPQDQDYRVKDHRGMPIRGVREGDRLPGIQLIANEEPLPELSLTLEPAALGLSRRTGASWRERCEALLSKFGPCGLAFLESLLRAADVRASRLKTADPTCVGANSHPAIGSLTDH